MKSGERGRRHRADMMRVGWAAIGPMKWVSFLLGFTDGPTMKAHWKNSMDWPLFECEIWTTSIVLSIAKNKNKKLPTKTISYYI